MSGLVPLSTVEDDFFVFDPARNHLVGRRTRRIIRLGDRVTVQVAKVETFKKQVDFRLAQDARPQSRSTPPPRRVARASGQNPAVTPRPGGRRPQPSPANARPAHSRRAR
jgi:ribonuclease R